MKSIKQKRSKSKRLGEPEMRGLPSFLSEDMETKVALIQSLVPLGLMAINDMLQREVAELAGNRYQRDSVCTAWEVSGLGEVTRTAPCAEGATCTDPGRRRSDISRVDRPEDTLPG